MKVAERTPLLVLGLGNVLCGDDGLGVAAVERLAREWRPLRGVRLLDGGTLGLALLPALEGARRLIVIDALRCARDAGSLVRIRDDEVVPALRDRLSPHEVGLWDLFWAARLRGRAPARIAVIGLVPASLEVGLGLSPPVEAALPSLVEAVADLARRWGFPLTRA